MRSLKNLNTLTWRDNRIEIVGFNYSMNEKAIYGGTFNANDGTYQNDRNPNAYFIQYKILPEPGKDPSYENYLIHQVSFAKIHHHAARLNILNAGSGDLLRNYCSMAKNSIM